MALRWVGPFRIDELLRKCLDKAQPWPPNDKGVYVVTRWAWKDEPTSECEPLYFGGNTGRSQRFVTRVGDLVADMHGLYGGGTGHHSGGQKLYKWCRRNDVMPGILHIGWTRGSCGRCLEAIVANQLAPAWSDQTLLNRNRPPGCFKHGVFVDT